MSALWSIYLSLPRVTLVVHPAQLSSGAHLSPQVFTSNPLVTIANNHNHCHSIIIPNGGLLVIYSLIE